MHSDLHTTSSSSLPPANLEFDNRPFQIRSTLIYSLNKSPWTILELGSNFTDFFHEFRECIVYRERNEIRNEKKKKEKKKKERKKENSKIDVIVHAATLASKLTFLSASTRFAYTWFAQEFHSNQRNEDRSLDWPIRC